MLLAQNNQIRFMAGALLIASALAAMFFGACVHAQPGLHMGFRVGPQLSMLTNQDDRELGTYERRLPQVQAVGEVFVAHYFRSGIGVQLGAGFVRHGTTYQGPDQYARPEGDDMPGFTEITQLRLDNFVLPLTIGGWGQGLARVQPSWQIGLQLNWLQNAQFLFDRDYGDLPPPDLRAYPPVRTLYRTTTWSALALMGIRYKLRYNLFLTAHARLEYSLSDVEDKRALDAAGTQLFWQQRLYDTPSRMAGTHPLGIGIVTGLSVVMDRKHWSRK